MQIEYSQLLRTVAYVCMNKPEGMTPVGTAFLVSPPPLAASPHRWVYVVTAAHVVQGISQSLVGDKHIWLRLNDKKGLLTKETTPSDWVIHPDAGADVAAYRWWLGGGIGDHLPWSSAVQLSDDIINQFEVGPGDEVYIVGLFSGVGGKDRNIPIIRVGHIAAMPGEPIPIKSGKAKTPAFLIQALSTGGLSGAPVFVYLSHMRMAKDAHGQRERRAFKGLPSFWMGMIHGHYDQQEIGGAVNMGIAIVIPHERIVDVINSRGELEYRNEMEQSKWTRGMF